MTGKKKPARSAKKKKTRGANQRVRLAIGLVIVGVLSLAALIVHFGQQTQQPRPLERIRISTYDDVYNLVEQELLSSAISSGWRRIDANARPVRLQMYDEYPDSLRLMELATRIALTDSPAQLDLAPRKGLVRVYWQSELRLELHYRVSEQVSRQRPQVAIIMDDMGRNLAGFRDVISLTLPVTPAILPQTSYATRGAGILKREGREYMIHLPMEPKNYPAVSPGPEALMTKLDKQEIRRRVQLYMQRVPGAVGGNNHMGSRFTEDRPAMHTVLEELKDAGLFFVDSRTIGDSVAFDEARRMGLRTAQRNIFLDNEENVDYVGKQLHKMIGIAEEKGIAIAICHPHPQTFAALRRNESWLRAQDVDYVLVSQLVRRY